MLTGKKPVCISSAQTPRPQEVHDVQWHKSQTFLLHSTSRDCGTSSHHFTLPVSSVADESAECYSITPHRVVDTPLYCCVPLMPFRQLPLWPFISLTLKSAKANKCFYATAILCAVQLFAKEQSRLVWWKACFLCCIERTIRLLLSLSFPCWLTKKPLPWLLYFFYCHQRPILWVFPSLYFNFFFLFCQVKLHLRVSMLICFRWRLFYIYKTWTHRSMWTDHPCKYLY